jgi:hypothetical protein
MKETPRNLSLGQAGLFRPFAFPPAKPAHFAGFTRPPATLRAEPRTIPVEHLPSPRSAILLKIVAMETYSANIPRLDRRRRFCERFRST